MLSRAKVLQTIKDGKRELGIEDVTFEVRYATESDKMGKRAEIFIWSEDRVEIVLYPTATFFSVRHELCHAKLFKMGLDSAPASFSRTPRTAEREVCR